jgi:hypothetical protein
MPASNLDRNTGLSILGLIITILGAVIYISSWMAKVEARLTALDKLEQLDRLTSSNVDRWRGRDMEAWAARLKELNPDLRVPVVIRDD